MSYSHVWESLVYIQHHCRLTFKNMINTSNGDELSAEKSKQLDMILIHVHVTIGAGTSVLWLAIVA